MKNKVRFGVLTAVVLASLMTVSLAFADIVSGTYTSADSSNVTVTGVTINKPTVSEGEFMLASIVVKDGVSSIIIAPPGWTEILRTDSDASTTLVSYWKVAGTSEPSAYTWLVSKQTPAKGTITPYASVKVSDPIIAYEGNSGFDQTATTANITTTAASSTVIMISAVDVGDDSLAGDYFSTPDGMTEKYDISNISSGPSIAQFETVQSEAGETGSMSSSLSGIESRDWATQIIALRYAAPLWAEATSDADWGPRAAHSMLDFDGKMWVLGGTNTTSANYNDDWSSTDGITWTEEASSTPWSARIHFSAVSYDGKMWVMGGHADSGFKNDVWSSTDGITWAQATSSAGWGARRGLAAVVYDSKIWVLGGEVNAGRTHDVWSSTDGITWTQETSSAPWSAREDLAAIDYDGKMWVIGGLSNAGRTSDVWSSTDGVNWTQETSSAAWGARADESVVVHDGKMWVLGGLNDSGALNDAWSSTDGVNWTQETSPIEWDPRYEHASVEYDNKIWVTGGNGSLGSVWYSLEE